MNRRRVFNTSPDRNILPIVAKVLNDRRGYISKLPEARKAVIIISGGLDSIATSAFLIQELKMELYPLHIRRGQTNHVAEDRSVDFFTNFFQKKYGSDKFHEPQKISVNIPPSEIKSGLINHMKQYGYPMRDPVMHLLGVQYAIAVSDKIRSDIRDVYCAIVPEDYFPHSSLAGLRVNTLNTCINMNDWRWNLSAPNIDPLLLNNTFGKKEEIMWSMTNDIPIGETISCNLANSDTNYLACGTCSSCSRRSKSFLDAGFDDPTRYYKE